MGLRVWGSVQVFGLGRGHGVFRFRGCLWFKIRRCVGFRVWRCLGFKGVSVLGPGDE